MHAHQRKGKRMMANNKMCVNSMWARWEDKNAISKALLLGPCMHGC